MGTAIDEITGRCRGDGAAGNDLLGHGMEQDRLAHDAPGAAIALVVDAAVGDLEPPCSMTYRVAQVRVVG